MINCILCGGKMVSAYSISKQFGCEKCLLIETSTLIMHYIKIDEIVYDIVFEKRANISCLFIQNNLKKTKHEFKNINIFESLTAANIKDKIKKYMVML